MDVTIQSLPTPLPEQAEKQLTDMLSKYLGSYHDVIHALAHLPLTLHIGGWRKEAIPTYIGGTALLLLQALGATLTFDNAGETASYFGKLMDEIDTEGKMIRIIGRDAQTFAGTMDLQPTRLNLYLVNNRVVYASRG